MNNHDLRKEMGYSTFRYLLFNYSWFISPILVFAAILFGYLFLR